APDASRRLAPDAARCRMRALSVGLVTKLSPASVALTWSLTCIGLSAFAAAGVVPERYATPLDVTFQAVGLGLLLEYVIFVGRLAQPSRHVRACIVALRFGQLLALLHVVLSFDAGGGVRDVQLDGTAEDLL